MKYYISDLHFGHARINDSIDHRGFANAETMDKYMITQWNSRVREDDEVFILGDLTVFTDGEKVNQLLKGCRKKILIVGNHDNYLESSEFRKELFQQITPYLELQDTGRKVILSHYPMMFYNEQYRRNIKKAPKTYMLYGHVHNGPDEQVIMEYQERIRQQKRRNTVSGKTESVPCQMINCFCMFSEYIPSTLDEWIALDNIRKQYSSAIKQSTWLWTERSPE